MIHWLRALAVFPEDLCSIPGTHMAAYNIKYYVYTCMR